VLSVNAVIGGMRNLLARMLGEDVELLTTFAPDAPAVEADPVQLQQVLLNLAANARDAMPRGGRLGITTAAHDSTGEPSPSGVLLPAGRFVRIVVEDDGVGMDAETKGRIFEPFFTTKVQGKGTGLGLATVYGIITQTGGDILCESEPGGGTRFVIYLPATTKKPVAASAQASAVGRRGETVLLVEDQDAVRTLARRILQSQGYTVIDTADGAEALAIAERCPFDVLVTDVVMPHMSGPELAKAILQRKPGTRVMFMSGYASHSAAEEISEAPLVQKPFTPGELLAKLNELLQRKP
jgi:CheY-like chemotaxis protein